MLQVVLVLAVAWAFSFQSFLTKQEQWYSADRCFRTQSLVTSR